jgi:hypothetical protein
MLSQKALRRFLALERRYHRARHQAQQLKHEWETENRKLWERLSLDERTLILTGECTYEDIAI